MKPIKPLFAVLLTLLLLAHAWAQTGPSPADRRWVIVSDDSISKMEVADISATGRANERSALLRIKRNIPETWGESLMLFHCGRRQIAVQTTTVYGPDSSVPIEIKNPKAPFARVKKNSANEKALTFVCSAQLPLN